MDKSDNLGWKVYAKADGLEEDVTVHFSEAFNTYDKLRRNFREQGHQVVRGQYDYIMDIPLE